MYDDSLLIYAFTPAPAADSTSSTVASSAIGNIKVIKATENKSTKKIMGIRRNYVAIGSWKEKEA